jgi:pyruvate formate lyase activating enzyme
MSPAPVPPAEVPRAEVAPAEVPPAEVPPAEVRPAEVRRRGRRPAPSPSPGLVADTVTFSWVDGPGNRFVLFLQGCNLKCTACHNPHTIPLSTPRARVVTVPEVLEQLRRVHAFLSGVTVSGGEATLQADFVHDLFAAVRADPDLRHLTTYVDTNGVVPREVWDRLLPVTDAAMVDLKAFDAGVHEELTGSANDQTLDSIRHLAAVGKLHEVRLLLVPGHNDSADQLSATARWLLEIDPAVRVKVIAFRRHGVRASARDWPEASEQTRDGWRLVLTRAGVRDLVVV